MKEWEQQRYHFLRVCINISLVNKVWLKELNYNSLYIWNHFTYLYTVFHYNHFSLNKRQRFEFDGNLQNRPDISCWHAISIQSI